MSTATTSASSSVPLRKNAAENFAEWYNFQELVRAKQEKDLESLPKDYRELLPDRGTVGCQNGERPGGLHRFGPSYRPDRRNHAFTPTHTFAPTVPPTFPRSFTSTPVVSNNGNHPFTPVHTIAPTVAPAVPRSFASIPSHQLSSIHGILRWNHAQNTPLRNVGPVNNQPRPQQPQPPETQKEKELQDLRKDLEYVRLHVIRWSEQIIVELDNMKRERASVEKQKKELAIELEECRRVRKKMETVMQDFEAMSVAKDMKREGTQKIWTHPYQSRENRGDMVFEIKLNHDGTSEMLQVFANDDIDVLLGYYERDQEGRLDKEDLDSLRSIILRNTTQKNAR